VNLVADKLSQRLIDELMASQRPFACEGGRNDDCFEVCVVVADYAYVGCGQAGLDQA
jgi:hypothetical protein